MSRAAVRSRLLQLRRDLAAAREGRLLLDQKREAIVRALADRLPRQAARRQAATAALGVARQALRRVQDELGRAAITGAGIAQPLLDDCQRHHVTIASVRAPTLTAAPVFTPHYGPATGSPRLDQAGAAFATAVTALVALASEDVAVRRLRAALARTARRLNALDHVVLPQIADEIHSIAAALEEDERDEATRRKIGSRCRSGAAAGSGS